MKMILFTPLVLVLFLFCLSCSPRSQVVVQQPPAQEKQVDVITGDGKTVDVRITVRKLNNQEMYKEAWDILLRTNNARLSCATVNLLKTVLDNQFSYSMATDDSINIRERAVALLGLSRNPDAIDTVADHLVNDPSWRVREAAGDALGKLEGKEALPALLEALEKHKISDRNEGFLYAGEKAVPHIIRWMEEDFAKNGGKGHAGTHVQRLREIGDRRAIEPLFNIIAHPSSPVDPTIDQVRTVAAHALAHFASEEWYSNHRKDLTAYLAIPQSTSREGRKVNATDRRRIIGALQNAGYDVNRLLLESIILLDIPEITVKQVDVITKDGKTVDVRIAARNLHNRKMYNEARENLALTKYAYLSSPTVILLKTALNDKSMDIRINAVGLLGLSRNPDAIDIVADRMFNDPHRGVRAYAGRGLGQLAGEGAFPALLEALEKHKISNRNKGFLYAGEKAVPHIIRWMEEDFAKKGDKCHAETYVKHLMKIGDRRAIEPLFNIIAHPSYPVDPTIDRVRNVAAHALAHFASKWYSGTWKWLTVYLAVPQSTLRERRKVNAADRSRIIEGLKKAGYDINSLISPNVSNILLLN